MSTSFSARTTPFSPASTTASTLNYSAYNIASRGPSIASTSYPGINPSTGRLEASGSASGSRSASGAGTGGLRPPNGGAERKQESRDVARVHYRALKEFLASWLKEEAPSARASAREKLTRLTKLQFQELSTDVYDELMRRIQADGAPEQAAPFLPVRDDFHPKRNQARQKLATLPKNRFKDLASDVFFELRRRYPEFQAEREDDEPPPAPGPRPSLTQAQSAPDQSRSRVNPTPPPIARLNSNASSHMRSVSRDIAPSSQPGHRSRPSRDRILASVDRDDSMEQLDNSGYSSRSAPGANLVRGNSSTSTHPPVVGATAEVVVPNKSRLREEDIEVPYARDSVLEGSGPSASLRSRSRGSNRDIDPRDRESQLSSGTGISARIQAPSSSATHVPPGHQRSISTSRPVNPQDAFSPTMTDDREYYDRMSFSSNVTGKSRPMGGGGATGWDEEREQKLRQEYEFRIAGLERRLGLADQEREEARRGLEAEMERRKEWEDEVRGLKERATAHASSLRSVQHELDIARDAGETARRHAEANARNAEDEIEQWRRRCEGLEDEMRRVEEENRGLREEIEQNASRHGQTAGGEAVDALKTELHGLVDELNALSIRNDELVAEREQDAAGMNEMESRVEEYRRKYEAVRIELRNLKATSTMFVSKPLTDDHLPASPDGNIADVNVSAFQTGVDGLLAAARSSAPSGVLPAMKAVVEAITEIGEDVKAFEASPNLDIDSSRLESLKHESTARLSALMQAARNHAMASGLSPVSLLDAAAGHLSANVIEIIKLLKIRKTVRRRQSSLSIKEMVGRDALRANGDFDREYGPSRSQSRNGATNEPQERAGSAASTSRPAVPISQASSRAIAEADRRAPSPGQQSIASSSAPYPDRSGLSSQLNSSARSLGSLGEPTQLRGGQAVNSYQSASSAQSQSLNSEQQANALSAARDPRSGLGGANPNGPTANGYRDDRAPSRTGVRGDRGAAPTPPPSGPPPSLSRERDAYAGHTQHGQQGGYRPGQSEQERYAAPSRGRASEESQASSPIAPVTARSASGGAASVDRGAVGAGLGRQEVKVQEHGNGREEEEEAMSPGLGYASGVGSDEEWEELKPYLNTQSSNLVNSIQNLLAAIRTNQHTPALTEHLSEVIAIASSIVAVAGNALPASLRGEGEGLLNELVNNTNKLSEAQEQARGAGFGKEVRQGIAAASFGVAKGLKSLMKLGVD